MLALVFVLFADSSLAQPASLPTHALVGPYASLQAACDAARVRDKWPDMPCHLDGERCTQLPPIDFADGEARVVRIGYECTLAIQRRGGWWLQPLAWVAGDRHYANIEKLEVRAGELIVHATSSIWWHENDAGVTGWYTCEPWLMVCSTARCTDEIALGFALRCELEGEERRLARPDWRFRRSAQLVGPRLLRIGAIKQPRRGPPPSWLPLPRAAEPGVYRLP